MSTATITPLEGVARFKTKGSSHYSAIPIIGLVTFAYDNGEYSGRDWCDIDYLLAPEDMEKPITLDTYRRQYAGDVETYIVKITKVVG